MPYFHSSLPIKFSLNWRPIQTSMRKGRESLKVEQKGTRVSSKAGQFLEREASNPGHVSPLQLVS